MLVRYTDEMLAVDLSAFLNTVRTYSETYYQFFLLQQRFGTRFEDTKHYPDRWEFFSDRFIIHPSKHGQPITWWYANVLPAYYEYLKPPSNLFWSVSPSTACYYFKTFYPQRAVYHKTKSIRTHLFRHSNAKAQFSDTQSYEWVQYCLGETDIRNAMGYVNSELYCLPR